MNQISSIDANEQSRLTFWETIKTDLKNSYLFIIANKTYFIYIIILVILSQYVNISPSRLNKKQYGGSNSQPNNKSTPSPPEGLSKKEQEKQEIQNQINQAKLIKESKKQYNQEMKEKDNESKANLQRIGFFQGIKAKFGKGSTWGGQYGSLGPVFGNMDKIFGSVKTVFYIVTIILTIAGVLSIPVLIFLIITYMVFKAMLNKFTAL